ncbi:cation diffusion facilitator family transporter [Bermanella sp. R86510]|uniref:cation diffusion facilitator family transporter n=1 Tax=unclassified Bermanella TaxID=2627862 RepID=UPI0037CB6F81
MHQHNHKHHYDESSSRIGLAFFLNAIFTIIEFIGGWLTNSTAIMADAVHDLGDSLSIGSAWLLNRLGKKSANGEFTYGYRRLSLLGALINGLVLIVGSLWILSEAIPRLMDPVMPVTEGMLGLAILGIAVNGYAAFKLNSGKTLNEKILNWHLLEDVLGWVAVFIVSIILLFFQWPILDPILSIFFTIFILINVGRNFYSTIKLFLQAVPDPRIIDRVREILLEFNEVDGVHHLHFWSLDGERNVMTVHVELEKSYDAASLLNLKIKISESLECFELEHTTIEFEFPDEVCRDQ